MSEDNKRASESYDKMIEDISDANMRYYAEKIHEVWYENDDEELLEVPADFEQRIRAYAHGLEAEHKAAEKRKSTTRTLKRCAAIFLVVAVVGAAAVSPSSALRARIMKMFVQQEDDHISINAFDANELADWEDYYMFSELPEGYEVVYVEDGFGKTIIISDGEGTIVMEQYDVDTVVNIDNDRANSQIIDIRNREGYCTSHYENDVLIALHYVWIEDGRYIDVTVNGQDLLEEVKILKMIDGIEYIK